MSESAVDRRLARVTDFGARQRDVAGTDFYRKAAPFMRRVNGWLDKVMLVLVALAAVAVTWLAFGAELEDAYVSDGVRSCRVATLSQANAARVPDVHSAPANPSGQ